MTGPGEDRRAKTREALARLQEHDPRAAEREGIGAQVALLAGAVGIMLVGWIPVAEGIRIPFLMVAFLFAFVLGLYVKRSLDRYWDG